MQIRLLIQKKKMNAQIFSLNIIWLKLSFYKLQYYNKKYNIQLLHATYSTGHYFQAQIFSYSQQKRVQHKTFNIYCYEAVLPASLIHNNNLIFFLKSISLELRCNGLLQDVRTLRSGRKKKRLPIRILPQNTALVVSIDYIVFQF